MLGSIFTKEICKIVNWQNNQNNPGILTEKDNSGSSFDREKSNDCVKTWKSIRSDNLNKLFFAHLSINTIRNKSNFLKIKLKVT